jgi:hypothetical protein
MITKVNNIMNPVLSGYGDRVLFNFVSALLWTAQRKSQYASLYHLEQEQLTESATGNSQLALFITERQSGLRPAVAFSKIFLHHRSV